MPATTTKFVSSVAALFVLAAACGGGQIDTIDPPAAGTGGVGGATGGSGGATGGTGGATGGTGGATGGTGGATGGTGGATGGAGGTGGATGGVGGATGGSAGVGGSDMAGSAGTPPATGGVGGGAAGVGGTGGDVSMGGTAGTDVMMAGMGGSAGTSVDPSGGTAGTGAPQGGTGGQGPYSPRTGTFKVLAYSKTGGFRHTDAINAGKTMLMAMGTKQGFTVTFTENTADISAQNLAQYEVVFGLNPTGNNLNNTQKSDFQDWMENKNGGFAGVHSSTDHENGWAFYSEVTGQYYDLHNPCCAQQNIQWDPAATSFIAVAGLPSPWQRSEEWYKFNSAAAWSTKPGFKVLGRVTTSDGGTRPVSFVREYGNYRSFYTSLGHEGPTYSDANFIKHVAAGLMWAARREALLKP